MFIVAYGTAMPTQPGDVYHGQQISPGYTRVGVEQVCQGWETLELDIPGGDGERTLEKKPFMATSYGISATLS